MDTKHELVSFAENLDRKFREIGKDVDSLKKDFTKSSETIVKITGDLKEQRSSLKQQQTETNDRFETVDRTTNELRESTRDIARLHEEKVQSSINNLRDEIRQHIDRGYNNLDTRVDRLQKRAEAADRRYENFDRDLDALKANLSKLDSDHTDIIRRLDAVDRASDNLTQLLKASNQRLDGLAEQCNKLNPDVAHNIQITKDKLHSLDRRVERLLFQCQSVMDRQNNDRMQLTTLQQTNARVERTDLESIDRRLNQLHRKIDHINASPICCVIL